MKQLILTQFPWTELPLLALVIFFCFFVGLIIQLSRKSKQDQFQSASNIPLLDPPIVREKDGGQNERQ